MAHSIHVHTVCLSWTRFHLIHLVNLFFFLMNKTKTNQSIQMYDVCISFKSTIPTTINLIEHPNTVGFAIIQRHQQLHCYMRRLPYHSIRYSKIQKKYIFSAMKSIHYHIQLWYECTGAQNSSAEQRDSILYCQRISIFSSFATDVS